MEDNLCDPLEMKIMHNDGEREQRQSEGKQEKGDFRGLTKVPTGDRNVRSGLFVCTDEEGKAGQVWSSRGFHVELSDAHADSAFMCVFLKNNLV